MSDRFTKKKAEVETPRSNLTRRRFLGGSMIGMGAGAAAIATSRTRPILGANGRVRVGFIGVGNRGTQLLDGFMTFDHVEVAALCDVYEPYLYRDRSRIDPALLEALGGRIPEMNQVLPEGVSRHKDFRRVLDDATIDAVVIATPDHWHAIQTIEACRSGKDVYVEKPLTATIHEGRRMVEEARRHERIVQVGLQRRSSSVYSRLPEVVRRGDIGQVTVARAYHVSNMFPDGIGQARPKDPPPELDWDLWLGPRAWRDYQDNIHPYRFRWWGDYSSQVGNWGVHYFDAIRWMLGEEAPVAVSAHGGKFVLDDDRTIPDTLEVTFEFESGCLLVFGQYEASGVEAIQRGEIELRGTLGNLYSNPAYSSDPGYRIIPSPAGQFQVKKSPLEEKHVEVARSDSTIDHIGNFLECMESRKETHCPLEEGHRSTTFAHLANIALDAQARIEWDPKSEKIIAPESARHALHYEYRKPWTLS